jgi:DNA-binding NarL/FixJ family response regulator
MRSGREGTAGPALHPAPSRLTVGLADADPLSTFGLRRRLRSYVDRVSVVDGFADADLVLVDPHLHLKDITDITDITDVADVAELLGAMPADGVVVYTWAAASGLSGPDRLTAAGWPLRGWLSKGLEVDVLVDGLEGIHAGRWVSLDAPDPVQRLRAVSNGASRAHNLTVREGQIVSLIAAGFTNRQIADHSYLSVNTVKTSIRSAYRKMGVSGRTQAVVWAVQHDHVAWPSRVVGRDEHR